MIMVTIVDGSATPTRQALRYVAGVVARHAGLLPRALAG